MSSAPDTVSLGEAVELLDRALAYTRVVLAHVTDDDLDLPTPCSGWSLSSLLAHMDDSLDAFLEAASGVVLVELATPDATQVGRLREKACTLLGAWSLAAPTEVAVGDLGLASSLLVRTAALEITVHGWDVSRAIGHTGPIPLALAHSLLRVAETVVDTTDRGVRFGPPRPTAETARYDQYDQYDEHLLGFLGRDPSGPLGQNRRIPATRPGQAF